MQIIDLIDYNTWANRLISSQIENLPSHLFEKNMGGSFPSMRATLTHLLESDWRWINHLKGITVAKVPEWPTSISDIRERWKLIEDDLKLLCEARAHEPDAVISFTTRTGQRFSVSIERIVLQITHHGSYHRGQLTNMIRMSGNQPDNTDYILFCLR